MGLDRDRDVEGVKPSGSTAWLCGRISGALVLEHGRLPISFAGRVDTVFRMRLCPGQVYVTSNKWEGRMLLCNKWGLSLVEPGIQAEASGTFHAL